MKKCPYCLKVKPLCEFWADRAKFDGRQSYCKTCQRAIARGKRSEVAVTQSEAAAQTKTFADRELEVLAMRRKLAAGGLL